MLKAGHEDDRPWEHATHMYNLAEVRADVEWNPSSAFPFSPNSFVAVEHALRSSRPEQMKNRKLKVGGSILAIVGGAAGVTTFAYKYQMVSLLNRSLSRL